MADPGQNRLAGRRILITGAASGIGRASATLFAAEGARLALLDRAADGLASIAGELGASAHVAELTEEAEVDAAVAAAVQAMGGLDGVVNCAGVASSASLATTTLAEWRRVLDSNLTGTFLLCRAALPALTASEGIATIVNLGSGAGLLPVGSAVSYAAAKAGVVMLSKALALELAPGIRVNVVCPGAVDTPMLRAGLVGRSANPGDRYALKRVAQPAEIAAAILFLTAAESSFVTGIAMAVDGGRSFH